MGLLDYTRAARNLVFEGTQAQKPVAGRPRYAFEPLSDRELSVLRLVAKGLSNIEISDALGVSVHTTKSHMGAILRKLDVPNRTSAISIGRALALIE